MRFSRVVLCAAGAGLFAGCGGDSNGPSNTAPTAAFDAPVCSALACTFTGASSTDDGSIASYKWDFGDPASGAQNTITNTGAGASHSFSSAATYTVTLTVTDNDGATGQVTHQVTVDASQAPVADFTFTCASLDCTFTNASTGNGTLASSWDFGDGTPISAETSPQHTFGAAALTTYTVTLTVTDGVGTTGTKSVDVSVSPPATLTCGATPDCSLALAADAKVTVTLTSADCQLSGNTFKVTITPPGGSPVEETLFTDGCHTAPGTSYQLQSDATFAAGTTIQAQIISGGGTLQLPPAVRVTGSYPNWTLEFDDGAQSAPPEPDFNDLVISIVATP
ncbi:MAG: PKD domain-containing protein [Gammaproteobacteria bacterium]